MSGVGLDWYKREPVAYLGDTQGLSSKEHAVYAVVVDLLYIHGGTINNDPSWIAGWIKDMGTASVRNTLASLGQNPKITLVMTDTEISQKRAKNEAKTKQKQRENAAKNGQIGGVSSGKSRSTSSKNNDLGEADASLNGQAEKRREEYKDTDTNVSVVQSPPPIDEIAEAVSAYNATAEKVGWPKVQKLSPARRTALRNRLKDCGGATGWEVALSKAEASPFLTGQTSKPFMASFDFITKQSNFTKIMEGNYDDRSNPNSPAGPTSNGGRSSPHGNLMAGFAQAAHSGR